MKNEIGIDELEQLLASGVDVALEILPTGEIVRKSIPRPQQRPTIPEPERPLTWRQALASGY